jgi:hypothetical protein
MRKAKKTNPKRRKGNPNGYKVVISRTFHSLKGAKEFAVRYSPSDYIRQISKTGGSTWEVLILDKNKPNPSVPKGKFISCKAVKFNKNGSVSIKK